MLITVLALRPIPGFAAELTVAEQVAKLRRGTKIKVELSSGETLKGRMGPATVDQFTLEPRGTALGSARTIRFREARSVRKDGMTGREKWIVFGLVWVAFSVAGYSINH